MSFEEQEKNYKHNTEWEVLTPNGWKDFDGIKKVSKDFSIKIKLDNEKELICSGGHQIYIKRENEEAFLFADILELSDTVLCEDGLFHSIESIEKIEETCELYDLVNVDGGYQYYTNEIASHNCAHIENIESLWLGLRPTLSTGGSAILISSPSGVGTLFHKIWVSAVDGDGDFHPIELPWDVHPERDQKWFEGERKSIMKAMGERGVAQELLCSFAASGDTFINTNIMEKIFEQCKEPIAEYGLPGTGKHDVWIWKQPKDGHKYVIGADCSRGDSDDFSAFHVIDTNKDEVVAEYKGKILPDKFAELLVDIGYKYNTALICSEKNNVGIACAYKLKDLNYPNLFYEKFQKNMYMVYSADDVRDETPGIEVTVKNRLEMLVKLQTVLRNGELKVYSRRLFEELQTYIWKGNKPQAQKGYNDDVVSALAIANNLYEAGGTNSQAESGDLAKALLMGMSVNRDVFSKTPTSPVNQEDSYYPPIMMGDNKFKTLEQQKYNSDHLSKQIGDADNPFWKAFGWVLK